MKKAKIPNNDPSDDSVYKLTVTPRRLYGGQLRERHDGVRDRPRRHLPGAGSRPLGLPRRQVTRGVRSYLWTEGKCPGFVRD